MCLIHRSVENVSDFAVAAGSTGGTAARTISRALGLPSMLVAGTTWETCLRKNL